MPTGKWLPIASAVHAEHRTGRQTPLFARGRCQRRETNDVPHCPNVLNGGAIAAIDLEPYTGYPL